MQPNLNIKIAHYPPNIHKRHFSTGPYCRIRVCLLRAQSLICIRQLIAIVISHVIFITADCVTKRSDMIWVCVIITRKYTCFVFFWSKCCGRYLKNFLLVICLIQLYISKSIPYKGTAFAYLITVTYCHFMYIHWRDYCFSHPWKWRPWLVPPTHNQSNVGIVSD